MMYVVHIDCEQFFVHACGLIYTWLVDSNFSQKHSIFNRLIKKETPQNGVFLDVLIIPPQHNFDLPSFITFYFNSSIKLFISQFRILCWQKKLSFLFTKMNYSCLYNLLLLDLLLAYSKGTKNNRAATFTHKIQREKKTRLNFFAKLQSFFSLPLFLLEKAF